MKYNKIVLAGGNGYLGRVLETYYKPLANEIIILSRKQASERENVRTLLWDGRQEGQWATELEGTDLLINLCGKNVNCRYTKENKEAIISSRTEPTRLLAKAIAKLTSPPALWINITSATIYRHAEDHPQDEMYGDIGYGFSIDVCKQWEEAFFESVTPKTRKIALRTGFVLGRKDSAFPRLLNMARLGLGGKQGDGQQYISWIHEQDVAKCTEWLLRQPKIEGVLNCTAPEAIKNTDFMKLIREIYGIPFGLPSPVWLLELGALIIGTETELILKSRWVKPARLMEAGYPFLFSTAEYAIKDILCLRV